MRIASSVPRFAVVGVAATSIHVTVAVGLIEEVHGTPVLPMELLLSRPIFSHIRPTPAGVSTQISVWIRGVVLSHGY